MKILIRIYDGDYFENPKEQPHPKALKTTVEITGYSGRTRVTNLVAKLDENRKPYIDREESWEYPEGWFEKGRNHSETNYHISRLAEEDNWYFDISTLEELDQVMQDLKATLEYEKYDEFKYILKGYM